MKLESRRSSLELVLLGMLFEEPMHAYRMRKLISQRGMDKVVAVRHKASVNQALHRLCRQGLIQTHETGPTEGRKDRVFYAISDLGREIAMAHLPRLLGTVDGGFTEFPAAVSVLTSLAPDVARTQFQIRADAIGKELSLLDAEHYEAQDLLHVVLLKYRRALLAAEHTWVRTIIADLSNGLPLWGGGREQTNVAALPVQCLAPDLNNGGDTSRGS